MMPAPGLWSAPRVFIFFGKRRELSLESRDPPIEPPPLRPHVGDRITPGEMAGEGLPVRRHLRGSGAAAHARSASRPSTSTWHKHLAECVDVENIWDFATREDRRAWNALMAKSEVITSIGTRDWAKVKT
jgi:hypothetical protein